MFVKFYKIRALSLLASFVFLCQCTTSVNSSLPEPATTVLNKKQQKTQVLTAKAYLNQATKKQGIEKQKTLLLAAHRALAEARWPQGAAILAQTSDLPTELNDEKNILQAQLDLAQEHPQAALSKLSSISAHAQLTFEYQILYYELLAQVYHVSNKLLDELQARIKLTSLLRDNKAQQLNRKKLWSILARCSADELSFLAVQHQNEPEYQGWLQLALIAHQSRDNPRALVASLKQWQGQFAQHPANSLLPLSLESRVNKISMPAKKVALLLPLSGPLEGPGTAVRDGFLANKDAATMQISTYDTNTEEISALYQTAINHGAEYVVGPLIKTQVAAIAALPHPVPTILLNEALINNQDDAYVFGLSPLSEAIEVANRARSKGYRRALLIAPENDWGHEITKVFTQQWQKNGGQIADTLVYGVNDDLNSKIKDFLHINSSLQRERKIKELLGYKVDAQINRRQDADMIFLLAYPTKARQIMPLLRYYYAADVPVFATSAVYSGQADALKDKDLDGLMFCDIPWVFSHQQGVRYWPEQFNSYNRLFALGKESYRLISQLNHLLLFPADEFSSGDGLLYLNSSQHIAHVFEWGQFRQGLAHSLGVSG